MLGKLTALPLAAFKVPSFKWKGSLEEKMAGEGRRISRPFLKFICKPLGACMQNNIPCFDF